MGGERSNLNLNNSNSVQPSLMNDMVMNNGNNCSNNNNIQVPWQLQTPQPTIGISNNPIAYSGGSSLSGDNTSIGSITDIPGKST